MARLPRHLPKRDRPQKTRVVRTCEVMRRVLGRDGLTEQTAGPVVASVAQLNEVSTEVAEVLVKAWAAAHRYRTPDDETISEVSRLYVQAARASRGAFLSASGRRAYHSKRSCVGTGFGNYTWELLGREGGEWVKIQAGMGIE